MGAGASAPAAAPREGGGEAPQGGSPEHVPAAGSHGSYGLNILQTFGPGNPFVTKRDPEARPAIVPVSPFSSWFCLPASLAAQDAARRAPPDLRGGPGGDGAPGGRPDRRRGLAGRRLDGRFPPAGARGGGAAHRADAVQGLVRRRRAVLRVPRLRRPQGPHQHARPAGPLPRRLDRGEHRQLRRPADRRSPSRSASPAPAATSSSPRTATAGTPTGTRSGRAPRPSTTRAGPRRCGSP